MAEPVREHGGWNRCRACKHDGPCPCSGERCCDRFLLCGHCPEASGHVDECCILLEYPDLLAAVERLRFMRETVTQKEQEAAARSFTGTAPGWLFTIWPWSLTTSD